MLYYKFKTTTMRKSFGHIVLLLFCNLLAMAVFAQSTVIPGTIKNAITGEALASVSIIVQGSGAGTFTNGQGNFKLVVNQKLPVNITISSIGYATVTIPVTNTAPLDIKLSPARFK